MCNKEHLVSYLYDDLSASDRAAFEAHVDGCAACRGELRELQQTRQHLAAWSPPEPAFDIRVARRADPAPRRFAFVPAWGLAAAASLLVLAGAAAIANLEVRVGADGLVVRTGWAAPSEGHESAASAPGAEAVTVSAPGGAPAEWTSELRALEARLREIEQDRAAASQAMRAPAAAVTAKDADVLEARLRRVIAEGEARQRTEMARQISQVWKDFNGVRASDFVRVQESLDRVQGQTNYQLRQHRDSIQSLYLVSLQK